MSVTLSKSDGVTVLTVVSDPNSRLPPLCQILKGLCYSLVGCSVPQHLRTVRRASLLVLGTLHIMIGLLSFSLGTILHYSDQSEYYRGQIEVTGLPYWSAALFVIFGIICILSEMNPCPCLVLINIALNLVGIIVAVGAIVLYSINILPLYHYCGHVNNSIHHNDECSTMILSVGINGVLIGLSALELCVAISSFVLAIKLLKSLKREENPSSSEAEQTTHPEIIEIPYDSYIIPN